MADKTEIVATMHTSKTETLFGKGWCPNIMGFTSQPLYAAKPKCAPTAFRWTPAMSAVFPVRLTMSQLTAMWLALHDAAEYSVIGALTDDPKPFPGASDGWIEWNGGKCPVNDGQNTEVKFRNGNIISDSFTESLRWTKGAIHPEYDIIAFRLGKP